MRKILRQFRFYGNSNSLNSPEDITSGDLERGEIFFKSSELKNATIVSFGIQTVPGVQFYINDSPNTVIVGPTGIYELNLQDGYEINVIKFIPDSLDLIEENNNAYLIVDVMYEVGE